MKHGNNGDRFYRGPDAYKTRADRAQVGTMSGAEAGTAPAAFSETFRRTRNAVFADVALLSDQRLGEIFQQVVAELLRRNREVLDAQAKRCVAWMCSLPCSWSALMTMSVRTAAGTVNLARRRNP